MDALQINVNGVPVRVFSLDGRCMAIAGAGRSGRAMSADSVLDVLHKVTRYLLRHTHVAQRAA